MTQARPFIFDTEFDASGAVVKPSAWRPARRSYAPAEVDALVAQARLEAREAALSEGEGLRAMALASIAEALAAGAPTLARIAQAHREQAVELALTAARVLAGAALDRTPLAPLKAALETLGQEIDASPRLVIHAPELDGAGRQEIERLCADAGFGGAVAFRDAPGLPRAGFMLEWADGRAEFTPEAAAARIAEALASALVAEAGHAETLNDGRAV